MTAPETEFVSILGAAEKSDRASRISSRSLPEILPILGLSDIVIFPGAVVPLLVETGASLKLVDDIVAGDRLLLQCCNASRMSPSRSRRTCMKSAAFRGCPKW